MSQIRSRLPSASQCNAILYDVHSRVHNALVMCTQHKLPYRSIPMSCCVINSRIGQLSHLDISNVRFVCNFRELDTLEVHCVADGIMINSRDKIMICKIT